MLAETKSWIIDFKERLVDTMMWHTISPTLSYVVARRTGVSNNNPDDDSISSDDMISSILSFLSAWRAYIANRGEMDTNNNL